MGKRQIDANEVMKDIRLGMNDSGLMEKYRLSARGLESLFQKLVTSGFAGPEELSGRTYVTSGNGDFATADTLPELAAAGDLQKNRSAGTARPSLPPHDVLKDIRGGMSDLGLMAKYKLTATGLQSLFRKLISAGLVTQLELDGRPSRVDATADIRGPAGREQGPRKEEFSRNGQAAGRKCPSCGMPMSDVVQECLRCGFSEERFKAVQAKKQRSVEARWVCPSCNKPQAREFSVCPACGVYVSRLEEKWQQEKEAEKKLKGEEVQKSLKDARDVSLSKGKPKHVVLFLVIFVALAIIVAAFLYFHVTGLTERSNKSEESRYRRPLIQTVASPPLRVVKGLSEAAMGADSRDRRIVLDMVATRYYYEKLRSKRAHSSAGRATGS